MASLTINIDEQIKKRAQQKTKQDGVTLTFIVNQALKSYTDGALRFGLIAQDDEVTASFDISTKEGKQACLKDFESLCS